MARYSSDSDSDRSNRHRRKHYGRSRSSSSNESSDACSYRKRSSKHSSRSKRRRRTRSKSRERDRTSKNYKTSRGNSRDKEKRRYRSKKSKSCSPDDTRSKGTSPSVEKSSARPAVARFGNECTSDKSVGLLSRDEFTIEPKVDESILNEINAENFVPKTFASSSSSSWAGKDDKFRNIVIDVSTDTIRTPAVKDPSNVVDSIFHKSILNDQEARFVKWVKKLYTLRQKAIADVTHGNLTC